MNLFVILLCVAALVFAVMIAVGFVELNQWIRKKKVTRDGVKVLNGEKSMYLNLDGEKVKINSFSYRSYTGTLVKADLGPQAPPQPKPTVQAQSPDPLEGYSSSYEIDSNQSGAFPYKP